MTRLVEVRELLTDDQLVDAVMGWLVKNNRVPCGMHTDRSLKMTSGSHAYTAAVEVEE